jgi:mRNA-degrading endonuclease RelE of RelBE toxin-antitoxin system
VPATIRAQVRQSLERLAAGHHVRNVKSIRGTTDAFERLRVGDYRVMFDRLDSERVILVLGIVHRRDLERWIRNR